MGLFENARRPAKTTCCTCPGIVSSPPPSPPTRAPKKNHPQPTQNAPPIKFPHYQCADPGTDPMSSPHPVQRTPAVDSHPEPQPTCALAPKNAHLKPSRHRTGTTTVTYPTPSTTATRAPRNGPGLPVIGPSPGAGHPSIPPPFHWLEEKCPKTSSQEPWIFFFKFFDDESTNRKRK